jgi:tetratricopeptide (TPR) repeat protein
MMIALLVASLVSAPHFSTVSEIRQSLWNDMRERLRAESEDLKGKGISIEAGHNALVGGVDKLCDFATNIVFNPADFSLKVGADIKSWGRGGIASIHVGGSMEIGKNVETAAGHFSISDTIQGIASTFSYNRANEEESLSVEGKDNFLVGKVMFGDPKKGPAEFGIDFEGVKLMINPYVMAKYVSEHRQELVEHVESGLGDYADPAERAAAAAAAKVQSDLGIGGISVRLNLQDLAYALNDSPTPPPAFAETRIAASLKNMAAGAATDFGELNHIDGLVLDGDHGDVVLLGSHDPDLPRIPVEVAAALARSVYVNGTAPFISIDLDHYDLSKPQTSRIGGVPQELRSSELIRRMLHADYEMKRFSLGLDDVQGIRSLKSLLKEHPEHGKFIKHRLWISPRPLTYGDVRIGKRGRNSVIAFESSPIVSTAFDKGVSVTGPTASGDTSAGVPEPEIVAGDLTSQYAAIERQFPEAMFGEVRQIIELATAMSILREQTLPTQCADSVHRFAAITVPSVEVPSEFDLRKIEYPDGFIVGGIALTPVTSPPEPSAQLGRWLDQVHNGGSPEALPPIIDDLSTQLPMPPSELAKRLCQFANDSMKGKKYDDAIGFAATAAKLAPGDAAPPMILAAAFLQKGDMAAMLKATDQAIRLDPDNANCHLLRAVALTVPIETDRFVREHKGIGLPPAALEARCNDANAEIDRLLALQSTSGTPYLLKAIIEDAKGDLDSAITLASKALDAAPDDPEALYFRAQEQVKANRLPEALADANAYLIVVPTNAEAHAFRAKLRAGAGDYDRAADDYRLAAECDPTVAGYHFLLAKTLLKSTVAPGFYASESIKEAEKAIELAPTFYEAFQVKAEAEELESLDQAAIDDYREACKAPLQDDERSRIQARIDADFARMGYTDQVVGGGDPSFDGSPAGVFLVKTSDRFQIHKDHTELHGDYTIRNSGPEKVVTVRFPEFKVGAVGWPNPDRSEFASWAAQLEGKPLQSNLHRAFQAGLYFHSVRVSLPANSTVHLSQAYVLSASRLTVNLSRMEPLYMGLILGQCVTFSMNYDLWRSAGDAEISFEFAPDCRLRPNPVPVRILETKDDGSVRLGVEPTVVTMGNSFVYGAPVAPLVNGRVIVFRKPEHGTTALNGFSFFYVSSRSNYDMKQIPRNPRMLHLRSR